MILRFDSASITKKKHIFFGEFKLQFITKCKLFIIDGTFKVDPGWFNPLLPIRASFLGGGSRLYVFWRVTKFKRHIKKVWKSGNIFKHSPFLLKKFWVRMKMDMRVRFKSKIFYFFFILNSRYGGPLINQIF